MNAILNEVYRSAEECHNNDVGSFSTQTLGTAEGFNSESEGENCVKYAMISVEKVRRIETNNMYKIKIYTS